MKFYLENKYSDFFSRKHCFLSVGPSTYVCLYTPLLFHFIWEFLQICHACLLPYEDLHMLRKCDWTFCEGLGLLCLTPLLTIFQLYCGGQFYWWMKPEYPKKTTSAASHWQTLSHNVVSNRQRLSEIRTHNVSGDRHSLHR